MAHEISNVSGRDEIAYAGDTPWHGLGTKVDGLQSAQEMLKHAGLLWTVEQRELWITDRPDVTPSVLVRGHKALVRTDHNVVLGVASARYQPIQNTQAGDMVDALVTEGGAHVEVAGALGQGERCWMLAHIPADFEVVKGDEVRPYFLLAWGHDGKHGLAGKLTSIRVVCKNTLTAAGFAKGARWRDAADVYICHYGNPTLRIDEAHEALGLVREQVATTAAAYRAMAAAPLYRQGAEAFFGTIFPGPVVDQTDPDLDEKLERWNAHQTKLLELFDSGSGSQFSRGTVWGAYNAVTEWTDHVYPVLKNGEVSETRQQSVLFGSYAETKRRAFNEALALVG